MFAVQHGQMRGVSEATGNNQEEKAAVESEEAVANDQDNNS